MMSEHLAGMNEKLTTQKEEIDMLKYQLNNKVRTCIVINFLNVSENKQNTNLRPVHTERLRNRTSNTHIFTVSQTHQTSTLSQTKI